jgi:hypothetical protein
MEHGGECNHGRSTKEVNDMILSPYIILDVEMELQQVSGLIQKDLSMTMVELLSMCLLTIQEA